MTGSFNLIDEPWIIVFDRDGRAREQSIAQVFRDAGEIVTVGGDIPSQQFAVMRLLLAILRRAVDWGGDPLERWGALWERRTLPADEIERYLQSVHSRFDLLDDVAPFYQVTDFPTAKPAVRPVGVMIADLQGKHPFFSTRAGSGAADLSLAEAARWIVHTQAYDPSGIKTGSVDDPRTRKGKGYPMGIAWTGQLGGVLLEGATLSETLLLNTVLVYEQESSVIADDRPAWERPHPGVGARDAPIPSGPIDLLTWQSRRIKVIYSASRAVGVLVGNGDPIEPHRQRRREYLSGWRFSANKSKEFGSDTYYPRTFDADRSVWEGFESLLTDVAEGNRGYAPAVVGWLDKVVDEGYVDDDAFVSPHTFGLRYDTQASVVGAAVDDRISMRMANFGRAGCRRDAIDAVRTAGAVAAAVANLARDLAVASGGVGDGERSSAHARFLSAVDIPYRGWLTRLGVERTDQLQISWHRTLYGIATSIAGELIRNSGRPAFIGRTVANSRGAHRLVDAAGADQLFRSVLRRELIGAVVNESNELESAR
ncbi:type I-E CRISPR-associated protein Cse1/CasA [Gordonia sp. DT101]|uniref:type I-E CRISPR-associated protein Cse1/CasA n=1 Tax=Gordonia sp. DT101 TaxID=3416545 RepID=UPI003CEFB69D